MQQTGDCLPDSGDGTITRPRWGPSVCCCCCCESSCCPQAPPEHKREHKRCGHERYEPNHLPGGDLFSRLLSIHFMMIAKLFMNLMFYSFIWICFRFYFRRVFFRSRCRIGLSSSLPDIPKRERRRQTNVATALGKKTRRK